LILGKTRETAPAEKQSASSFRCWRLQIHHPTFPPAVLSCGGSLGVLHRNKRAHRHNVSLQPASQSAVLQTQAVNKTSSTKIHKSENFLLKKKSDRTFASV